MKQKILMSECLVILFLLSACATTSQSKKFDQANEDFRAYASEPQVVDPKLIAPWKKLILKDSLGHKHAFYVTPDRKAVWSEALRNPNGLVALGLFKVDGENLVRNRCSEFERQFGGEFAKNFPNRHANLPSPREYEDFLIKHFEFEVKPETIVPQVTKGYWLKSNSPNGYRKMLTIFEDMNNGTFWTSSENPNDPGGAIAFVGSYGWLGSWAMVFERGQVRCLIK